MTKKNIIILIVVFIVIVGLPYLDEKRSKEKRHKEYLYSQAEEEVRRVEWVNAISLYSEIGDYKDSKQKIDELYDEMYELILHVEENGNYDFFWLDSYLRELKNSEKYKDKIIILEEKIEEGKNKFENNRRKKLKLVEPYVGMNEEDIEYSSWGEPTEVNYSLNYNSMTEKARYKEYKWIEKDKYGRIIEIKSFLVKQNKVYTEPKISKYYP